VPPPFWGASSLGGGKTEPEEYTEKDAKEDMGRGKRRNIKRSHSPPLEPKFKLLFIFLWVFKIGFFVMLIINAA